MKSIDCKGRRKAARKEEIMEILIKNQPYLEGYEGAFYRFTTESGAPAANGIFNNWYITTGTDANGTEYEIVWHIVDFTALKNGDEDCCNWDKPDQILNLDTYRPIDSYSLVWE